MHNRDFSPERVPQSFVISVFCNPRFTVCGNLLRDYGGKKDLALFETLDFIMIPIVSVGGAVHSSFL